MPRHLPKLVLAVVAAGLPAQNTGRTLQVLAPVVLGQTAAFGLDHPGSAIGNPYAILWCMPPATGTQALSVPGFAVQGLLRLDPALAQVWVGGVLPAMGTAVHSLAVPSHASFLGVAWSLQSVDLSLGTATIYLGDQALTVAVAAAPGPQLGMVAVAPGTFAMGSPATGGLPYMNNSATQPVHTVTLRRPFWIGQYEVSQAEYTAVMGTNPSFFQGPNYPRANLRPVERVSWHDAAAYCAALTTLERGAGRVPSGYAYRLPTEAEWEYCCRAGSSTEFAHGAALVCGDANFGVSYHSNASCGIGATELVGSFLPNAWGLYDMHGNVWEWCLDSLDAYPAGAVVDPLSQVAPDRVLRGGGWGSPSYYCRSAVRGGGRPASASSSVGFRIVLAPEVR